MGPRQSHGRSDAAAEAETHYLRMCRLRRLSYGELRILLSGDLAKAAPWIESAARYGVAEAQVRLGQMRLDGAGVPRDEAVALDWFLKAAKSGSPEAMNMAGRCYENGWGAAEASATAAHWYRRSAEAGCDWGGYNYANMLFDGRGVAQDREAAVAWYGFAAARGHARAMNLLARCHEEGWGTPRDPVLARDWYRRSAEGGYFRAQFNHATLLTARGRIDEALNWFETAVRAATPESMSGMTAALIRHEDPRLADLGRRLAR
jgi:TPR repeat protein